MTWVIGSAVHASVFLEEGVIHAMDGDRAELPSEMSK